MEIKFFWKHFLQNLHPISLQQQQHEYPFQFHLHEDDDDDDEDDGDEDDCDEDNHYHDDEEFASNFTRSNSMNIHFPRFNPREEFWHQYNRINCIR